MELPDQMRRELKHAMKTRDLTTVAVLRTALAAIDNAEAPPISSVPSTPNFGQLEHHARLELTRADLEQILCNEIAERRNAHADYIAVGRDDRAELLQAEIAVLSRYVV